MTIAAGPAYRLSPPLATDADTAVRSTERCSICHRTILTGQRFALVVPDGKAAHLPCIALAASLVRRSVPVIR